MYHTCLPSIFGAEISSTAGGEGREARVPYHWPVDKNAQ